MKINVSFAILDGKEEAAGLLAVFLRDVAAGVIEDKRILLVIPSDLAKQLGWDGAHAPRPAVGAGDLVFLKPEKRT